MRKPVDIVNQHSDSSDDDVLELVHTVMHDYRSLQYRFLRDGPHEITHMDGKVLGHVARHPGCTQSDLAQSSGRDKAQVARLVKGLREKGLLDAVTDEVDRRNVRLSLSADGKAVQRALLQQARRLSARAVDGLSATDLDRLIDLLKRVKANLGRQA